MKQAFRYKRFSSSIKELIRRSMHIVEEYQGQNIRLTLRQLYYQLVSRGVIANSQKTQKVWKCIDKTKLYLYNSVIGGDYHDHRRKTK